MEKITSFREFLNEGRGKDLSKEQLSDVNTFLKSIGVKTLVKNGQYIDGQGGFTAIGQSSLKDKDLGDLAIGFTLVWTNAHISVNLNTITLMIDCAAKTHNGEYLKTAVYWESVDSGKTFKIKK